MAQVILVTGGRGGVGKSTVCALLGQALAHAEKQVLLVEASHRSLDVICGVADEVVFDLSDAVEQRCELSDAILSVGDTSCLHLLCAPMGDPLLLTSELCHELIQAMDGHFDYIFIEVDGLDTRALEAYASIANRGIIVSTPDRVSARACRLVSDALAGVGVADIRLCINMLTPDFARQRPIPNLDWLIDSICAQLICVLPFDQSLIAITSIGELSGLSNISKMIFDNFAQRIMGYYIDLLVQ